MTVPAAGPFTQSPTRHHTSMFTVFTAVAIMLVAANLRPAVVAVAPLIDEISRDQQMSSTVAGLLTTLPILFFGLVAPVAPRLAARYGIERTIFGALVMLIVGTVLRMAPGSGALFAGSVIVGASIGICNVVLPALIKRDFAHRSGVMTGLYSMALSGGAAVAAAVTVPVDNSLDGRWYLTLGIWALLAAVTAAVWIPQLGRRRPEVPAKHGSVFGNRIAWAITAYMAAQSAIFYTFTAWLPTYLLDEGYSHEAAGSILAVSQVVALIASLIAPIVAGRCADQRAVTFTAIAICATGLIGLLTTSHFAIGWIVLVMLGPGASISLVLLFMVLRSSSAEQTGQVSGMAQSVGYVVAAAGPISIGALHDSTGSWTIALSALAIPVVVQALAANLAARNVTMS